MSDRDPTGIDAKVLTVSDGVIHGTREDKSGVAVADCLTSHGFTVVDRRVVADGVESVAEALRSMAAGFAGVIVTTGGTGFGPRDLTPEGTRTVIDREAPGLAEAMRLVNPLGRLSRGIAGTIDQRVGAQHARLAQRHRRVSRGRHRHRAPRRALDGRRADAALKHCP